MTLANKQKPTNPSTQRQAHLRKVQIPPRNVHYLNQGRYSISALVALSYPHALKTQLLSCLSAPRKAMLEPQEIHPSALGEKSSLNYPRVLSLAASQLPSSTGNLYWDHVDCSWCLPKAQPRPSELNTHPGTTPSPLLNLPVQLHLQSGWI